MKQWSALIGFLLLLLSACRSGHFETSRQQSQSHRVSLSLLQTQPYDCEKQNDGEICRNWSLEFQAFDIAEQAGSKHESWKFYSYDPSTRHLQSEGELKSDREGKFKLRLQLVIPQQNIHFPMERIIELHSSRGEEFLFYAKFNLSQEMIECKSIDSWKDINKNIESTPIPLALHILDAQSLGLVGSTDNTEILEFELTGLLSLLQDSKKYIPELSFEVEVLDFSNSKNFSQFLKTDKDGKFKFKFAVDRPLFSHQVQKKIGLNFKFHSAPFANKLHYFLILNMLSEGNPVHRILTPTEVYRDPIWHRISHRYASNMPPRLLLEDVEIAELPSRENWSLNKNLQLQRTRNFLIDFSLYLERQTFDGLNKDFLRDQKIGLKIGQVNISPPGLSLQNWRPSFEESFSPKETGRYEIELPLLQIISSMPQEESIWLLLESNLSNFLSIPSSFHLISWPKPFFRNLEREHTAAIYNLSEHSVSAPHSSSYRLKLRKATSDLQQRITSILYKDFDTQVFFNTNEARDLFSEIRRLALSSGVEVAPNGTAWRLYYAFEVTQLLDQKLKDREEIDRQKNLLQFEILAFGRKCLNFISDAQSLRICLDKEEKLETSVSYLLRSLGLTADRMIQNNIVEDYQEPSWMENGTVYYEASDSFSAY